MGEVVNFTGLTTVDIDPDTVLGYAIERLSEVLVIGWTKAHSDDEGPVAEGELYFAGSTSDLTEIQYLLKLAQLRVDDMLWSKHLDE